MGELIITAFSAFGAILKIFLLIVYIGGILLLVLIIRAICNYLAKKTAEETAKIQEQGKTTGNPNQQQTSAPRNPPTNNQNKKSVPWKWE